MDLNCTARNDFAEMIKIFPYFFQCQPPELAVGNISWDWAQNFITYLSYKAKKLAVLKIGLKLQFFVVYSTNYFTGVAEKAALINEP